MQSELLSQKPRKPPGSLLEMVSLELQRARLLGNPSSGSIHNHRSCCEHDKPFELQPLFVKFSNGTNQRAEERLQKRPSGVSRYSFSFSQILNEVCPVSG